MAHNELFILPESVWVSSISVQNPHAALHKNSGKFGYRTSGGEQAMLSGIPGLLPHVSSILPHGQLVEFLIRYYREVSECFMQSP